MLFEPNWDTQLIVQLKALHGQSQQPIVSTYPYGFEFENDQPIVKINVSDKTTLVLRPHPEAQLSPHNATLRFRAENVFTSEPVRGCHVAGGFISAARWACTGLVSNAVWPIMHSCQVSTMPVTACWRRQSKQNHETDGRGSPLIV